MARCTVKLYGREDGPVCYEANLFPGIITRSSEAFVGQLLTQGCTSHWASLRTRPLPAAQKGDSLPRARAITRLHGDTAQLLVADLAEQNEDGYGRELTILTTRGADAGEVPSFDIISHLLEDFVYRQASPLEMVYFQFDDSLSYVFVRSQCCQPIESFLASQRLTPVERKCSFPYKKLSRVRIEFTRNNILRLLFPGDPRTKMLKRVP